MKLFPDGNIYYGTSNGLERIFTKSHKASSVSWISSRSPTIYTDAESGSAGDQVKKFFATADETIIGVSRLLNSNDYGLIRFFPTPEKLSLTMLSNITNVQSVGSNLLLAGTDSDGRNRLVMYNTANSQETDLIPEEEIEIFNFMMSADQEKVYFDGLRFSDSTFVIAEYDLNSHRLAYLVKLPGKPKILDIIKDCTVPANSADYGSEGSWTTVTQTNAPGARSGHQSVWTGNEVLIWGGAITAAGGELQTGGLYSPNSDSWRATSLVNAPTKRSDFSMTWTGDKAIVFGGIYWGSSTVFLAEPKAYDPANDTWTSLSETNAPSARASHTAVWTGSRLIVWGGIASGSNELNTGAVYDPSSDTWTTMSTVSAPSARAGHTAVWTGSKMIVFGGYGSQGDLGGVYDPSTDSWTSLSTDGAPSIRWHHSAVWTGTRMLVWGGVYDSSAGQNNPLYYADGYSYDADSDSWQLLSESGRPPERAAHTAVWTGSAMIIFGGNSALSLGGMYYPSNETWVPINHTNALTNRQGHSGLWIGDRMMIWGGKIEGGDAGDGGVFTP